MTHPRNRLIALFMCWGAAVCAQDNRPLSVIDWLDNLPETTTLPTAQTRPIEPPTTRDASAPAVSVGRIGTEAIRNTGLISSAVTGLPSDLWASSDVTRLTASLRNMPELTLPAANAALYTLLLAESAPPRGDMNAARQLTVARLDRLVVMGALEPAQSLAQQAGQTSTAQIFDKWMDISLLTGDEDLACKTLSKTPHLSNDYAKRVFCLGRSGQWDMATVTLNSAQALGMIDKDQARLLDHFLNPDLFESGNVHRPPRKISPLTFRLFETIGEPLPTGPLPRAFAVADLRDLAGWKSQLEAAERLTRSGALPENRLLGLYTQRKPAASGGVWDRAAALQRFETALRTGSTDAISKTLPPVWAAMKEARLEVNFARLYAEKLAPLTLVGKAERLRVEIGLLSPTYETFANAAKAYDDGDYLSSIANGTFPTTPTKNRLRRAVARAFDPTTQPPNWVRDAAPGRLGEIILRAISRLEEGAQGDTSALTESLRAFRTLGMEDTARRAALQVSLLERKL